MKKKILSLLCTVLMFVSLNTVVVFGKEYIDPYEQCLNSLNKEYNLELGYVKVSPEEMSLEEYTKIATELAKEQRSTLDYIEMRLNAEVKNAGLNLSNTIGTYAASYTVSDRKDYSNWAEIYATYTCIPGTPNRVSSPKNVEGRAKNSYTSNTGRWFVQENWDYDNLDAGRTLGITAKGYTCTYAGLGKIDNVTIYGEFGFKTK